VRIASPLCMLVLAACGTQPSGPTSVVQIAGGNYDACAVLGNGSVKCWGRRGIACSSAASATSGAESCPPEAVPGVGDAVQVAINDMTACALDRKGAVSCWGGNYDGAFGTVEPERSASPIAVPGVSDVAELGVSRSMMCGLRHDGTMMAWGGELLGADRNPEEMKRRAPTPVPGITGAKSMIQGSSCCARMADGTTRCAGGGVVDHADVWHFEFRSGVATFAPTTAATGECGCELDDHATLRCKAFALPGPQLADGSSPPDTLLPCAIQALPDVTAFAVDRGTCAARTDGSITCWGGDSDSRMSGYDPPTRQVTIKLPGRKARALAAGTLGAFYALDDAGAVWGWGANSENAIPGAAADFVAAPVRILP